MTRAHNAVREFVIPVGVAALSSTDETLSCGKDTVNAESVGSGEMTVSLFGLFPLQKMQVEVTEKRTLIPGGQAVMPSSAGLSSRRNR